MTTVWFITGSSRGLWAGDSMTKNKSRQNRAESEICELPSSVDRWFGDYTVWRISDV